jgi:geranylgeranyl reductase family protein
MVKYPENRYDVTIVGAGPAGAILAYELAKKGVKVLILEKTRLPRRKVCAGGITVRAGSLIPFDFQETVENVVYGIRLSYKTISKKVRKYDQPLIYMVRREKFDYLLASRAVQAGATLQDGVTVEQIETGDNKVRVRTNSGVFLTPLLVGADGAKSAVVNSLGWKRGYEYGLAANGDLEVKPEKLAEWDGILGLDYGMPGGYAWVFPKRECLSVGAGGSYRKAKVLRPYILRLVQSYQLGPADPSFIRGHLMPMRRATAPLSDQRVLLVGDAAGVLDPLTGEGIFYSLRSVYLALPVILRFLTGKVSELKEYDTAVMNELGPELKAARTIQKMNSLAPRLLFHYFADNDRFWRAFCQLLRGERTYVGLKNRLNPPLRWLFRII